MAGAVVIIIWIIFFALRGSNSDQSTAKKTTTWPRVLGLVVWLIAIVALIISSPYDTPASAAILIAVLLAMFPSVWIRLPIKIGWIAPSYYLSFLILRVNGHALRAGAAFNAYRALLNKRNASEEFRRKTIRWLHSQVMRNKGKISSGDMLLCVLLDAEKNDTDTIRQLEILYFLRKKSVPLPMIRFAFARLTAGLLANEDWKRIAITSNKWRSKWSLPLASLIEYCYHRRMKTRYVDPASYFFLWLRCGCPRWLSQLPLDKAAEQSADLDDCDPAQLKQRLVQCALSSKPIDRDKLSHEHLLPAGQLAVWKERAQALHCREPEAAVAGIERSLATISGNAATDQPMTNASGQDTEEALTRLRFHAESIHRRQTGGHLQAGSVEFQEWLNFIAVYEQLANDSNDRYEAYSLVEVIVWNWMADLWNIKKERHLAFMMCGYMNPHAREFGSEASRVYEQVLAGKVG
ncbi:MULTISPECIES: hypothetical protein [unclassified Microbulbifer]|uniref:hypothetical protein n=1 Tax=unclassified Microbulbifer TaxID=2619833 RepID=UPI0027E47496|nr:MULTISPECIES: hypothetical protein [unclassified Microbulbifer]